MRKHPPLHTARLIAFDNDGTLYPAGMEVASAVLDAHRDFVAQRGLDLPTPSLEWVRSLIGADALDFFGALLPGEPEEVRLDFEHFCTEYEAAAVQRFSRLYQHVEELLHGLVAAGKTLVLISNGTPRYVQCIWDSCGYERWFTASLPFTLPAAESKGARLQQAMSRFGGPAVMVGDRRSDHDAARHADAWFIGCAYGYGESHEIEGADATAHSVDQLFELLLACQT
jgi:phosphoglycolate phosphatase